MVYLQRICDKLLASELKVSGAVLIEGAKWCGKTSTAQQAARSSLYMQDPDKTSSYLAAADTKPSLLLNGEAPKLIDEWQMAPVLWDAVRFEVERRIRLARNVGVDVLVGDRLNGLFVAVGKGFAVLQKQARLHFVARGNPKVVFRVGADCLRNKVV